MALVVKDRVQETSTTTGTGTFTLAGAVSGFQSFSAIGNGNTTYYSITDGTNWEVGIGTYTSSGTTLSRDTVLESSNSDNLVDFGAGSKFVFCTYPADKSVYADASSKVSGYVIENSTVGATTASTGKFTSVTTPSVTATTTDLTLSAISTGNVNLNTAGGTGLRVSDVPSAVRYVTFNGAGATGSPGFFASAGSLSQSSGANSNIIFYTNLFAQEQFRVSHTASAVNYVQVTGAATNGRPTISSQGSDTNIGLSFDVKGGPNIFFRSYAGNNVQLKIAGTNASVNNHIISGGASTIAPTISLEGSDTNISMAFQPKGTGAIDLAAGSSGVNISNGGTVTAITRTVAGSNYTTAPTVAISAPTTAGGVQATATVPLQLSGTPTIVNGGTGYTVGNTLTFSGGTFTTAVTLTVTTVSSGVITGVSVAGFGAYTVLPSNPVSVTGGSGSSATFTANWGIQSTFTITNAGSGYIEQPTITFSGGGGSGAAAYATVGSGTVQKTLANIHTFSTPNSSVLAIVDKNAAGNNPTNTNVAFAMVPQQSGFGASYLGFGSQAYLGTSNATSAAFIFATSVSSPVSNGGGGSTQLQLAHTSAAVNYVQVTGGATSNSPVISAQGSDAAVALSFTSKSTNAIRFLSNNAANLQFRIVGTNAAVNNLAVTGTVAGSAPILSSEGSDTNIDLALTPKGTGVVTFGTYTGTILTPTGFITIKDSGGTTRRLLVG